MRTKDAVSAVLGVCAVGAISFYLVTRNRADLAVAGATERPDAPASLSLPRIALDPRDAARITKIELTRPNDDDPPHAETITLEKTERGWDMTSPMKARASAAKVDELIHNLEVVTVRDRVDPSPDSYAAYDLTGEKTLHVVAWEGERPVRDLFFGKTIARGQVARIAGNEGSFLVPNTGPQGYSGFLFTRGLRSWRETAIFAFAAEDAIRIEITNRNGFFALTKSADTWSGSFAKRGKDGALRAPAPEWRSFDASTVAAFLGAYKSLSADDFGSDSDRRTSGLDRPEETGGIVRITLASQDGGSLERTLRVGNLTRSTTRWAIKGSRWAIPAGEDGPPYAVAPWTADWATAAAARFEASAPAHAHSP